MRRLLGTGQHPEAVFTATRFEPAGDGGVIEGEFTLHGTSRPLTLQVTQTGPGKYQATGSIVQSSYGIKPYSGFFGALKVRDAVVVGIPDEEWGQRVEAAVVVAPGSALTEHDLRDHVRCRLRSSKTPERIMFWDELPRSATGKLLRHNVVSALTATAQETSAP